MRNKTMKTLFKLTVILLLSLSLAKTAAAESIDMPEHDQRSAHEFSFNSIDGDTMPLSNFAGQVMVVVNTASQCGFTGQYEDLQTIYDEYKDQGFVVIGVPCNQFGSQEPDGEEKISQFVSDRYGVNFPLTSKAEVKGADIHPFFEWASAQKKGGMLFSKPRWNFHKFVIDRRGQLVSSFGSQVSPTSDKMRAEIERLLAEE